VIGLGLDIPSAAIRQPHGPPSNDELREDGSFELREDGSKEERE
jgi:hypothetical protein